MKVLNWINNIKEKIEESLLVVILGGSGSGKTTLLKKLTELGTGNVPVTVYTTRPKREVENSNHYVFYESDEEFQAMREKLTTETSKPIVTEFKTRGYGTTRYMFNFDGKLETGLIKSYVVEADFKLLNELMKKFARNDKVQLAIIDLGKSRPDRLAERGYLEKENQRRLKQDEKDRVKINDLLMKRKGKYVKYNPKKPTSLEVEVVYNDDKTMDLSLIADVSDFRKVGGSSFGGFFGHGNYSSVLKLALGLLRAKIRFEPSDYADCGTALETPIMDTIIPRAKMTFEYEEYFGDMFKEDPNFLGLIDAYDVLQEDLYECKTYYNPMKFKSAKKVRSIFVNGVPVEVMDKSGVPEEYVDQCDLYLPLWEKYYADEDEAPEGMYLVALHVTPEMMKQTLKRYYKGPKKNRKLIEPETPLEIPLEEIKFYWIDYNKDRSERKMQQVLDIIDDWTLSQKENQTILSIEGIKPNKRLLEHLRDVKEGRMEDPYLKITVDEVY